MFIILFRRITSDKYFCFFRADVKGPSSRKHYSTGREQPARRKTALISYHLLADTASAGYLWGCLTDAMAEYGGAPVGLSALARLVDPDRPA